MGRIIRIFATAMIMLAFPCGGPAFAAGRVIPEQMQEEIRRAREQNDPEAWCNIGAASMMGAGGLPMDYKNAEQAFRHAADAGHPRAQYFLAVCLGREGNTGEGASWLRRAADAGVPQAIYRLAADAYEGTGFFSGKNKGLSAVYFRKLVEGDFDDVPEAVIGDAYLKLSHQYRWGKGVEKDIDLADRYLRESEKRGNEDAAYLISQWLANPA